MPTPSAFPAYSIEPIAPAAFDMFAAYLNDHLSDNGRPGNVYFQPLPHAESVLSAERAKGFCEALAIPVGEPGWRRLWGAFTPERRLAGHIDLRARPEPYAAHRCQLGMGVERDARQCGLGRRLIEHAEKWALDEAGMAWIDLQVLTVNEPAMRLYQRAGYAVTGEMADMFRIDGLALSFTFMSKKLG